MSDDIRVERDGPVVTLDTADVLISTDGAAREALVTVAIPLSVLAALRALLNHPQLAAILDAPSDQLPLIA